MFTKRILEHRRNSFLGTYILYYGTHLQLVFIKNKSVITNNLLAHIPNVLHYNSTYIHFSWINKTKQNI